MKFLNRIFTLALILTFSIACLSQDRTENNKENKSAKKSDKPVSVKTNVLILDRNGQLANDIKAEDLKIFEDGVEQKNVSLIKISSVNVGLAIDNSGSVRTQLDQITTAAKLVFNNLRGQDEVFLVRFVGSDKIEVIQDWTTNKAELNEAAENMYVEGGQTAVLDAVYLAAEKIAEQAKKDATRRNVLIVISDCEDVNSFYTRKEVLKKIKESDVEIYTIGFTQRLPFSSTSDYKSPREIANNLADLFASETNGVAYFPKSSKKNQKEIVEAATSILSELRAQYRIEYVSTNQKSDDKRRKLRVEIADSSKDEKRTAIMRESVSISND
ncbi:MAG: VWA domain-containing protein [Acidobacteriota bacterium]|nr:VWA domain-containing protein [Acidobacteriota bacterium]